MADREPDVVEQSERENELKRCVRPELADSFRESQTVPGRLLLQVDHSQNHPAIGPRNDKGLDLASEPLVPRRTSQALRHSGARYAQRYFRYT